MIVVGLMTQAGFAGNLRYVALPAALVCVLAGVGWVDLIRAAAARFGRTGRRSRWPPCSSRSRRPFVVSDLDSISDSVERIRSEADVYGTLPAAIAKAGGPRRSGAARSTRATSRSRRSPGT